MPLSVPQAQKTLLTMAQIHQPVLMVGPPGIGKTDIARQVADILGWKIFIDHPAISAPEDYKGFAFFQNDRADFFPLGQMREIIECQEPAIWMIDDLGQAPIAVQNGIMQFVHPRNRALGAHAIPDHISIIAATNRIKDQAGVVGMTTPLKGRFVTIIEVMPDIAAWKAWAFKARLNPLVIAYLDYKPDHLHQFKATKDFEQSPTPRQWEHVHNILSTNPPSEIKYDLIAGAVGKEAATNFVSFQDVLNKLPDLDYIEAGNASKRDLPDDNMGHYAIVGALAARGLNPATLANICGYLSHFPAEYKVLWSEMWWKRNKPADEADATAVGNSQEWVQWVTQNKDILTI